MPDDFAPVPGDAVLLPDNQRATVQTVYLCSEPGLAAGDEVTRWSWIVLTDGRLLEVVGRTDARQTRCSIKSRRMPQREIAVEEGRHVLRAKHQRIGAGQVKGTE